MDIKIEKPRSVSDIVTCVDMYLALNDESFIDTDRDTCIKNMIQYSKLGHFIRMAVIDGEIAGWIYARPVIVPHRKKPQMQQCYYASNRTGIMAARLVKILNDCMAKHALAQGIDLVVSAGSHMDEKNTFARILEKDGWQRRGHIAVYRFY